MTDVEAARVDARATAVLNAVTTWDQYPAVWRTLLDEVHASVRRPAGVRPGLNVMLYLDDRPSVEVGILVRPDETLSGRVRRSALPSGHVARTVHVGQYDRLGEAHDRIVAWCSEHGLRRAGPRWEVYGHWYDDWSLVTTEVVHLLT